MDKKVEITKTNIPEPQMAQAIISVWRSMFGQAPSKEQVSMLLAQNNLETGTRNNMYNYNVGNITHTQGDGFDYWQGNDWRYNDKHEKINYSAKFRAYPNLEAGIKDYLKLLSGKHYSSAFEHILHPDPAAFSKALKAGGYYGEDEKKYTAGVQSQFDKVNKSNSYELAMAGKVKPITSTTSAPVQDASKKEETQVASNESSDEDESFFDELKKTLKNISLDSVENKIEELISAFSSDTSNASLKKLYKLALPTNTILIKVNAPDYVSATEFSRILSSALDEDLLSTSYLYSDGHQIEIECNIQGPQKECFNTVKQMSNAVAETFKDATKKIGGIEIKTNCIMNKESSYQPINPKTATSNYRQFLLKFI